jgi:hypothetical protein
MQANHRRSTTMRIKLNYIAPLLAAGAAAAAIAAAPTAAAAAQQTCVTSGSSTQCQSPGNVQINSSIPAPYGGPFSIYGPFFTLGDGHR